MNIKTILLSVFLLATNASVQAVYPPSHSANIIPPSPKREFRGAWIASVANIDWPSRPNSTTEQQQAELIKIFDEAVKLKLNAVILQVRPACDALYPSPYEPWSEYLTGKMGQAPQPYYDPLAFAVKEAHQRGLELHAWFNPYRAHHSSAKSFISPNHISKTHPELVRKYGKYLWLDPGEKAVQEYSLKVIMDVVSRYDIDGVHIDDYFYPYPERNQQHHLIDFPDEPSWQAYLHSGGKQSRDDWRRENINTFIQRLYQTIKASKPWVKVGISPFGVWQPGYPQQVVSRSNSHAFNAYRQIYADSRKWLQNGWLDYLAPQLYWKIEQTEQSYPVLLKWWLEQNTQGRHIWPGMFTSRVADHSSKAWSANEIVYQIKTTRGYLGASGNVHYSMKPLMQNRGGISDLLTKDAYLTPALVPASPWLDKTPPGKPDLSIQKDATGNTIRLNWKPTGKEIVSSWVVQTKIGNEWTTNILPVGQTSSVLSNTQVEDVAVSAVTRYGIQGTSAVVEVQKNYVKKADENTRVGVLKAR
ncbi:glycoside hydrolase family 10 protein [Halotia branconii]|uniref:Family 10 glycosylhydrolase n=1 Tax=Halotia branconii CENA392 TaxID=1539056 RepID=A0AAJ6NQL8_9CYAN|nr:family 10 glycosylhydrolase [Halotia branconii]WGV24787.1 family 10 glycosylhydrolase [Halotia branconii CENA392]